MDEQPPTPITLRPTPNALTPRQREVALLIAEGLTIAEIRDRLAITPGTTANHVEAVLRRLGAGSRVQIATWAIAHGLVVVLPPPAAGGSTGGTTEAAF